MNNAIVFTSKNVHWAYAGALTARPRAHAAAHAARFAASARAAIPVPHLTFRT